MTRAEVFNWLANHGYGVSGVAINDHGFMEAEFRPGIDTPIVTLALPVETATGPGFGALYDLAIGAPDAE